MRHTASRRGLAPLELVMALPFLVLLAAFIHLIARVGLAKTGANIQARREAWKRPIPSKIDESGKLPSLPLAVMALPENRRPDGLASKVVERRVNMRPVTNRKAEMKGRVTVLLDPLDHTTSPYRGATQFTPNPRMARLIPGGESLSGLAGISGGVAPFKGQADGMSGSVHNNLDTIRNKGDELLDRKNAVIKEITDLTKSKDPDKLKKIKEKQEELKSIDKSLNDIRKLGENSP